MVVFRLDFPFGQPTLLGFTRGRAAASKQQPNTYTDLYCNGALLKPILACTCRHIFNDRDANVEMSSRVLIKHAREQ